MKPLDRGAQRRDVVVESLVLGGQMLGERGRGARQAVAGERGRRHGGGGHGVAGGGAVRRQGRVEGMNRVGNYVVSLGRRLRSGLRVPVGVRAGGWRLVVKGAAEGSV